MASSVGKMPMTIDLPVRRPAGQSGGRRTGGQSSGGQSRFRRPATGCLRREGLDLRTPHGSDRSVSAHLVDGAWIGRHTYVRRRLFQASLRRLHPTN